MMYREIATADVCHNCSDALMYLLIREDEEKEEPGRNPL